MFSLVERSQLLKMSSRAMSATLALLMLLAFVGQCIGAPVKAYPEIVARASPPRSGSSSPSHAGHSTGLLGDVVRQGTSRHSSQPTHQSTAHQAQHAEHSTGLLGDVVRQGTSRPAHSASPSRAGGTKDKGKAPAGSTSQQTDKRGPGRPPGASCFCSR